MAVTDFGKGTDKWWRYGICFTEDSISDWICNNELIIVILLIRDILKVHRWIYYFGGPICNCSQPAQGLALVACGGRRPGSIGNAGRPLLERMGPKMWRSITRRTPSLPDGVLLILHGIDGCVCMGGSSRTVSCLETVCHIYIKSMGLAKRE